MTRHRRALRTSLAGFGALLLAAVAFVVLPASPSRAEVGFGTGSGRALAVGTYDDREVIALDDDGRVVASGDTSTSIGWISACDRSAWIDGSPTFMLVSLDGQTAILWNATTMTAVSEWPTGVPNGTSITDVTCVPGLAAVETQSSLVVSSLAGATTVPTQGATDVAVSNESPAAAFLLDGESVRVLDLSTPNATQIANMSLPRTGGAVAVAPGGDRVAVVAADVVAGESDRRVMALGRVGSGWTVVSDVLIPEIPSGPGSISWLDNYFFAVHESPNGATTDRLSVYGLAGERKSKTPVGLVRATISTTGNRVIALSAEADPHLIELDVDASSVAAYTMPGITQDVAASVEPIAFATVAQRALTTTTTTSAPTTTSTLATTTTTTTTTPARATTTLLTTTTTEQDGGDLGTLGPGVAIDLPDGVLIVGNGTNRTLTFSYEGEESGTFTVPGTTGATLEDCENASVESRQVTLEPGRYRVTASISAAQRLTSSWRIDGGNQYFHCFYVVGANRTTATTATTAPTSTTTARATTSTTAAARAATTTTAAPRSTVTTSGATTTTTIRPTTTTVFDGSPEDFGGPGGDGAQQGGVDPNEPQQAAERDARVIQGAPLPWLTTTIPGAAGADDAAEEEAEAAFDTDDPATTSELDSVPASMPFQRPGTDTGTEGAAPDGSDDESEDSEEQAAAPLDTSAGGGGVIRTLIEWGLVAAVVLGLSAAVVFLIRSIVNRGPGRSKKKSDDEMPDAEAVTA